MNKTEKTYDEAAIGVALKTYNEAVAKALKALSKVITKALKAQREGG